MKQALPDLPPRLKSAVLAAAENLTAIAYDEGVQLGGPDGEALPHLITILYLMRETCVAEEKQPQPYLGDQLIAPQDIASTLETIAQILISEGIYDFAGHNPSWFTDAALVVERMSPPE
jgi:hypothetical protein